MTMKKLLSSIALLLSAPAWATMWCGPNIAGTSTPACASVNATTGQVVVKARDTADITQHFVVTPDGRLRSAVDGRCIGARSATVTNPPEAVQARACTSTLVAGDRWVYERQSGAAKHSVKTQLGNLLAGATSDTPTAGSALTMWTPDGTTAQQWRFVDFPFPTRSGESTVRTLTLQSGVLKYDGLNIPASTELDCSVISGRYCKVPGSSPTRYARSLIAAPGVTATEIAAITITTTTTPVTVATAAAISGSAVQGAALTATPATFANCGTGTVNEWLKAGSVIATGTSYTPALGDVGAAIVFRSTACAVVSTASTATVVAASTGGGGTAPNTNTFGFFSANLPAGFVGSNPHWGPYPRLTVNGLDCMNNIWHFIPSVVATARQSVGCQAASNGGVDWRTTGNGPQIVNDEVLSYPEIFVGKKPDGNAATANTSLPKRIDQVTSAVVRYQSAAGNLTRGQLVTDWWLTTTNGCAAAGCRKVEVMWQYWPFGGYNAPAPWSKGGPGRTSDNIGGGPKETDAVYERVTLNGQVVDVYSYTPGTWGQAWRLIKIFPMVFSKGNGHVLDVKAVNAYIVSRGWANNTDYMNTIEVGIEPVVDNGPITWDLTVRGWRIDVQ